MNVSNYLLAPSRLVAVASVLIFSLAGFPRAVAQPTILSSVPASGATGVSPTAPVILTFSQAMNPTLTTATFLDVTHGGAVVPTTPTWNAGNTVLTNAPISPFATNSTIEWAVSGQSAGGVALGGLPFGTFTTGSGGGGGGGGSGTNAITSFNLGKIFLYDQNSTAAPVPDTNASYNLSAVASMVSNRVATAVSLTLPNSAVSNLTQNPVAHENFFLFSSYTNQTTFSNTWPDGAYAFTVYSNASSQVVIVTLPSTMVQPNAPHISNYAAAQAVNPAQPFTLSWDAFQGGTSTDFVFVAVENLFNSANPGTSNALPGTATSVVIPANTLQANSNYTASISFYRVILATNGSSYATFVYKASSTQFGITTGSGTATGPLVLTNAAFAAGVFGFDVTSAAGQTFTIEYVTNLPGLWQSLLTTNSATGRLRITDPRSTTRRELLYRARNGP